MKKITKLFLAFFMALSFTACSSPNETLSIKWEKENKFADLVSFQIETIGKPQQIIPDIIDGGYNYYKVNKESNVLIDMVVQMTNLIDKELELAKTMTGTFVIDKTDYEASMALVSEDGKSISESAILAPKATRKIHFYAEVSPKLLEQEIEFKFTTVEKDEDDVKTARMKFLLKDVEKHYETKKLNDTISSKDKGDIVLQAVNQTKKLEPANPAGLYKYYRVKSDSNSFVVVTTIVTNTSSSDINAASLASAKLIDQDGKEYMATMFYEFDDHSNLAYASSMTLSAGQSGTVHFAFEVSDEIAKGEKTIIFTSFAKAYLLKV